MKIDVKNMPRLGFGLMRLPQRDEEVDMDQVCRMVDAYMDRGFCYFDTAYVYHGGKSETVAREAVVKRYPRDSFYLATKLPAWEIKGEEDRDRIFQEQLERAGVDYFDFYLLHSLEDGSNYDTYERYDCFSWGMEKKAQGKIRHFGFSYHGTPELLEEVLDRHPEVPIIVMEPVKGGTLADLAPELEEMLKKERPEASVASWAMRFAGSLEGVMTVLSGMSNECQMEDNLDTFANLEPLNSREREVLGDLVRKMLDMPLIQCTSCRYCCDGCPSGIRIPDVFRALNTKRMYPGDGRPKMFYGGLTSHSGKASDCVGCGQCESVCPQHLNIIELMGEAAEKLE